MNKGDKLYRVKITFSPNEEKEKDKIKVVTDECIYESTNHRYIEFYEPNGKYWYDWKDRIEKPSIEYFESTGMTPDKDKIRELTHEMLWAMKKDREKRIREENDQIVTILNYIAKS